MKSDDLMNLCYYSKNFSILACWDGNTAVTFFVTDELTQKLIEEVEVDFFNHPEPLLKLDEVFDNLKDKYIFDYRNALVFSQMNSPNYNQRNFL